MQNAKQELTASKTSNLGQPRMPWKQGERETQQLFLNQRITISSPSQMHPLHYKAEFSHSSGLLQDGELHKKQQEAA